MSKNEKVPDPHGYVALFTGAARIVGMLTVITIIAAVITALT